MITNNFKALAGLILTRSSSNKGVLPITAYNGTQYWLSPSSFPFLQSPTFSYTNSASSVGICVGSGNTPAAMTDYQLETPNTSGLSASIVQTFGLDNNSNPTLTFDITFTNTSTAAKTIREIGYRQNLNGATELNGSGSNRVCLLDRTVLDSPVTIEAGEIGVIRYVLKTILGA